MEDCISSLCKMTGMNKTSSIETKDQQIIEIMSEINEQISLLTKINSVLNRRIENLEVEVRFLKLRRKHQL
jgi:3-deoxy-D-manno-octulosonate 8-phosphate phosphatase KdsC-like HAD superfamily phosphatase